MTAIQQETFSNSALTARRKTWLALVAVLLVTAGLAPTQADAEGADRRTVTKRYITGSGGYWMSEGICSESSQYHVGIVCLGRVEGGQVSLSIEDGSGRRVGGYAVITDGNGTTLHRQQFCQSSDPITLQSGVLFVYLDGPKNIYGLGCPMSQLDFATVGQLTATFSS